LDVKIAGSVLKYISYDIGCEDSWISVKIYIIWHSVKEVKIFHHYKSTHIGAKIL